MVFMVLFGFINGSRWKRTNQKIDEWMESGWTVVERAEDAEDANDEQREWW